MGPSGVWALENRAERLRLEVTMGKLHERDVMHLWTPKGPACNRARRISELGTTMDLRRVTCGLCRRTRFFKRLGAYVAESLERPKDMW
jgi:hypothetical protein